jgi:hypothetical protein
MYKQYNITLSDGSNSYTLQYELEPSRPAQLWAEIMKTTSVSCLRENFDPWQGIARLTKQKVSKLEQLVAEINQLSTYNIDFSWDDQDPQMSLNKLHIHFPNMEKNESNQNLRSLLSEYNDIIHQLEGEYRFRDKLVWLHILPDNDYRFQLVNDDYKLFTASRKFGDLCLHYPHVGRHPLEIIKAGDFGCPVEQIIHQHEIAAYHTLRFYDDPYSEDQYIDYLAKMFGTSTLKDKYQTLDNVLGYGYIKIGNLINYQSKTQILEIVEKTDKIVNWEITG